ncbi:MAG: peptidase and chymotrypsin/Hap [Lachnospiraceae bacterium]|jgi:serine protease Do|nr:peptidase and chymotrypsin/Hap [Lachnospiraceae bacterium]
MNEEYGNNRNEFDKETFYSVQESEIIDADVVGNSVKPRKKHKNFRGFMKLVAAGMVFGLVAGASLQGYTYLVSSNDNVLEQNILETDPSLQGEGNTQTNLNGDEELGDLTETSTGNVTSDVSGVVDNVMPSIVAINSVTTNVSSDFFGRQYSQDVPSSGSGIIIGQSDEEILIVTNNHVIENANSVEIVFADETTATAQIKGTAASSDLAVLSVNIDDLASGTIDNIKIATLGDSTAVKLGEMAIAIGNALGYGQSVTVGYISAINREVEIDGISLTLLQTDAAINPGNSGGALLNSKGEVIGINSVKYVDEGVEGIGYSIPISDAIPIINQLMNRETLAENERAYLGIGGKDVTSDYAQGFSMPVGIYVGEVVEGSAAQAAGIKVGDIITSVNDITVETMSDLSEVLTYTKAGTTGTVTIKSLDNGNYVEKTVQVTFAARP